jgi:hypothetical protein
LLAISCTKRVFSAPLSGKSRSSGFSRRNAIRKQQLFVSLSTHWLLSIILTWYKGLISAHLCDRRTHSIPEEWSAHLPMWHARSTYLRSKLIIWHRFQIHTFRHCFQTNFLFLNSSVLFLPPGLFSFRIPSERALLSVTTRASNSRNSTRGSQEWLRKNFPVFGFMGTIDESSCHIRVCCLCLLEQARMHSQKMRRKSDVNCCTHAWRKRSGSRFSRSASASVS